MSEIMNAVLRMPPTCWDNGNPIDEAQRHRIYVEAANLIETLRQQPTLSHLIDGLRLEWVDAGRGCFWRAETDLGNYYVEQRPEPDWVWFRGEPETEIPAERECDSIDDGKRLCESDYKQRVRAIFGKGE